jgi:pectate lyase
MKLFVLYLLLFLQVSCKAQSLVHGTRPVAFPGAEGFGKFATGGRGGKLFIVQNLEDSGPGSLREALTAKGKRTVVFSVSGTIHLKTKLSIAGDCTLAGQTAPGDGICIADQPVTLGGDNIIIQYMRFRMGDRYQNAGKVDGSGSDDALGGTRRKHIIIDHCSISWSTDECFSVYAGDSTTLQWNLIAEPLNYSYHFETGDTDFEQHGYGGIWGGRHLSAHHNMFVHCNSRTPRFDGIRNAESELVDFSNNVLYNWGHNNVYAGEGGKYQLVNNYYKAGPNTNSKVASQIVNPGFRKQPYIPYGKFYVRGNMVEGNSLVSKDNRLGIRLDGQASLDSILLSKPVDGIAIPVEDAMVAYQSVLSFVGASFQRDSLDQRIVQDVKTGKGRFIDVQGGFSHGTAYTQTMGAWPKLVSKEPPVDSDRDGIPDTWERSNGLNPQDPTDGQNMEAGQVYSNLERYIHSIVKH